MIPFFHMMREEMIATGSMNRINYFDLYASDPQLRRAVGQALKGRREKFLIQSHLCSVWKNG